MYLLLIPHPPRYDLFRNNLGPDVRHVWVAEYDVGWTGDIASVFASFPERPDFVCSTDWKQDGIAIGPEWSNFPLRTWLKVSSLSVSCLSVSEMKRVHALFGQGRFRVLHEQADAGRGHRQVGPYGRLYVPHAPYMAVALLTWG